MNFYLEQVIIVRMKNIGEIVVQWCVEKPENGNVILELMRDWDYFKLVPNKAIMQPNDSLDVQVNSSTRSCLRS
jgi:hypothetical protein